MSGHGRSVFVNSCIKKPLSPSSKRPNPSFLVPQCSLDRGMQDPRTQDAMSTITRKKVSTKCPLARNGHYRRSKCCSLTHQLRKETDNFQTMVQFYDSIPDYNDLLHLPREEFYCRLNTLKKKQKELKSICFVEDSELRKRFGDSSHLDPTQDGSGKHEVHAVENHSHGHVAEGVKDTDRGDLATEDGESLHSWSKSPPTVVDTTQDVSKTPGPVRKGSAKSVRIESTKEDSLLDGELGECGRRYRSGTPYVSDPDDSTTTTTKNATPTCATPINSDFVERYDRYVKRNLRCKSASPIRNLSNVTIPQPYKMTQREDEQRTLQELLLASKSAFPSREALVEPKSTTQFRANPVPITSRIPLLDTIMADQENRSRLAKLNSEIELQSQIKPFHFSERLNRIHSRCLSRSLSSPALLSTGLESTRDGLNGTMRTKFKARPCPRKLLSSHFQTKAWEDEYFRHLNKRLRAEEMLKQATLPPSMARRERSERKNCLSRHSGTTDDTAKERPGSSGCKKSKRKRKSRKPSKRRKSVEEKCAEYFASVSDPSRIPYPTSNSSCSNSTDNNRGSGDTPAPIYPVNRPNLAATLRTEWCRKKLRDLELDDSTIDKQKVPRFRWGVKKSQAFQNLNLDHTHEEELNLRLATRRAEQRLRQEEHAINMELMRQRVKAAPLLLEGPPQWGPRLGHVAHRCSSLNRESEQAIFRSKPDKLTKSIAQKMSSAVGSGPSGVSKKCDSPMTTSSGSTGGHQHRTSGGQERRHRSAEKRRNAGNGSKLSTYSCDSSGKLSYKVCDSELLSISDV